MAAWSLLLLLPALAGPPGEGAEPVPQPPQGESAQAPERTASPEERIHRALSVRHPVPSCADIEALSDTPVESLLRVVERASQPPWVPMRAAECLLERHYAQIRPQLERWVVAPELRGLGMLVLGRLDVLPQDLARDLATLSLTRGPDPEATRARLRRHSDPQLRALAEEAP